jgi:hypothetical protein
MLQQLRLSPVTCPLLQAQVLHFVSRCPNYVQLAAVCAILTDNA